MGLAHTMVTKVFFVRSTEVSVFRQFKALALAHTELDQGQIICPLYTGCPLFGMSFIRDLTVLLGDHTCHTIAILGNFAHLLQCPVFH